MVLSKTIASVAALLVLAGQAAADEFMGTVRRVEGDKITIHLAGKGKKAPAVERVLHAAANCRVALARYNKVTKQLEAGDEVAGGLKNPLFQNLGDRGVEALVVTDGSGQTVKELRLFQTAGKKKVK